MNLTFIKYRNKLVVYIMDSQKNKKSTVQSILFGSRWKTDDARKWLKKNKFKSIGRVQISKKTERSAGGTKTYTILSKDKFKSIGFKKTKAGISFRIGTLKK